MVNMTKQHALERQNGMIAGVCGGIAAYTGMSVFLVRLIFFLLLIPGGLPGLVPYLVLWLIMPKARY
jgi:phage shock protein C